MKVIVYNVETGKYNFLNKESLSPSDIIVSDMSGKIVLYSLNNVKMFDAIDIFKRNKTKIQQLLKSGYSVVNSDMRLFITQNYSICPCCGTDIDIRKKASIAVYDVGDDLSNIPKKNYYSAKELKCDCGHIDLYYYDIYATPSDRKEFAKSMVQDNSTIYIKFRFEIDSITKANIPIWFNLSQFIRFFNSNRRRLKLVDFSTSFVEISDIMYSLERESSKDIIKLLFNDKFCELIDNSTQEIKFKIKPIMLGKYDCYSSETDFDKIRKYEEISSDYKQLRKTIVEGY